MQALILAGGFGTRLQSPTLGRPKAMAKARGKPFLEYQVCQLRAQGFGELVLCVGYLADHIQAYFGDGRRWGVRITYAVETQLLGTAGAIRNAQHFIEETFLVLNGDSYLDADFRELGRFHRRQHSADSRTIGTIAAVSVDDAAGYGRMTLNAARRLLRFREKVESGSRWINGGVYVLEPTILDFIPAGRAVSIENETFPMVLKEGCYLFGYPVQDFFVDIGTPEGYRLFRRYVGEHIR